jgi:hypothetical protein
VDHFLNQYRFDEVVNGVKKMLNTFDFAGLKKVIDKKLEEIDKSLYNQFEYRELQIEKILELELHKQTKVNLNIFDENFYSYKLIF